MNKICAFIIIWVLIPLAFLGVMAGPTDNKDKKDTLANSTPAAIQVTGDSATRIKDAYTNVLFANKDLQLAISEAKYTLSVPKGYEFNLATFSFEQPKAKEEAPKETSPKKGN